MSELVGFEGLKSEDESARLTLAAYEELQREKREEELARQRARGALASESVESELDVAKKTGTTAYFARILVQATLPHSDPGLDVLNYERRNGNMRLSVLALPEYGLPFGTYPRLLMSWITTEAVRTKSPVLELGDSLSSFLVQLGLAKSGGRHGTVPRLRQHMLRLFKAHMSATFEEDGHVLDIGFRPVEGFELFWDPKNPDQPSLWQSSLVLNQRFFEEITRRPVPVNLHALRELARQRSPLALDLYTWLTYRMSTLEQPVTIPWALLAGQIGSEYGRLRDFRGAVTAKLPTVLVVYPQAKVEPVASGLRLHPSQPHIRLLAGGKSSARQGTRVRN